MLKSDSLTLIDLSDIPIDQPEMISLANALGSPSTEEESKSASSTIRHILLDCCELGDYLDLLGSLYVPYTQI